MMTLLLTRNADRGRVRAPAIAHPSCPDLSATEFAQVVISGLVGTGCRCRAFAGRCQDKDVVLKVYHARSVSKHADRCGGSLARYEYERNCALRSIPALNGFIAVPLGYVSSASHELFLQQRVFGEPLPVFMRSCSDAARKRLSGTVRMILDHAHRADIFDLDLQPSNIIVQRGPNDTAHPMLFDFNKVPYHERPPNAVAGWLLRLGLIDRRARDDRYWRRLEDCTDVRC